MNRFELINSERLSQGYTTNHLQSYKKYCNKMKRSYGKKDPSLALVYALEANVAKFKLLGSLAYLYKNLRLIKSKDDEFFQAYSEYLRSFISSRKNTVNIDTLISLRVSLADYYSFLDDIYCISDNRHNFDQYKVKYQWKDIIIVFETQKCLDSFLNKTFSLRDSRFNTQLALKILEFERNLEDFSKSMQSQENKEFQIFCSAKKLCDSISNLDTFLNENFIDSEYAKNAKRDSFEALEFIKKIVEFKSGIVSESIDDFQVPALFKDLEKAFKDLKTNRKMDTKTLRANLLSALEKRLKVDSKARPLPFSPIFYDLANDYVNYPTKEAFPMSKILKAFSFLNKK